MPHRATSQLESVQRETTDKLPTVRLMYHSFLLYGLTVQSAIDIPEAHQWEPPEMPADLVIRRGEILPKGALEKLKASPVVSRRPDGTLHMEFKRLGRYHVDPSRITFCPVPGVADDVPRLPLLGLVLSAVLVGRGLPVLHASALKIGNEAVAFIGDKGFGKSTMAATLWKRGHALISDDVVVLDAQKPFGWTVRPGPIGIKLWPDAIESLGIADVAHYPLSEGATKRILDTREWHASEHIPLRRIYVLGHGDHVEVEPISASDGLVALMRNAFMYRYPEVVPNAAVQLLTTYAPIRRTVDMRMLRRPANKERLTDVAEAIEADLEFNVVPNP